MFVCNICQIEQNSASAMKFHLNGKIHKKRLKKKPDNQKEHKRLQELVTEALKNQPPMHPLFQPSQAGTSKNVSFGNTTPVAGETFGVFVKGFPEGTDPHNLCQYFSKFGNVVKVKMGKNLNHAIVEFDQDVTQVTRAPCYFMGARLLVQLHSIKKTSQELQESFNETKLIENLGQIKTFDQQVSMLQSALQPNFQKVSRNYNQLCIELQNILRNIFPNSQIHPFGSTTTGLGFATSDVDVYVSNARNVYNKDSDKSCLYKTRAALQRSELFLNVTAIAHAKVPLVRCHHRYLDLNCDLVFSNFLGVFNSKLISYYMGLDWKLRPVMILIKFWAKTYYVTGQSHLMKNYALTMMFIFFLQQKPYCLPSVYDLQHVPQDPNSVNMQAGWNAGFSPYANFDIIPLRNESLLTLFKGFLSFYSSFDYESWIVCPYLGRIVEKSDFKDGAAPEEYFLYKINLANENPLSIDRPICVQDPFEHTRNITLVTKNILNDFVFACSSSLKILEQAVHEEGLLYNLFTSKDRNPDFEARFTIAMCKDLTFITKIASTNEEYSKLWFETLKTFTINVLEDVLKCEVTEEEPSDPQSILFTCTSVHHALWNAKPRNKLSVKDSKDTILSKQTAISDVMMQRFGNQRSEIKFQLSVVMKENPVKVIYRFQNFKQLEFRKPALFFMSAFPQWFSLHLLDLNKPVATEQDDSNKLSITATTELTEAVTTKQGDLDELNKTVTSKQEDLNELNKTVTPKNEDLNALNEVVTSMQEVS